VDGGVRSPTNADVLKRTALDLVVIVSPMSGRDLPRTGLAPIVRRYARRKLGREVATLRRFGTDAVVVEPGPDVTRLTGLDMMREDEVVRIVGAAFLDTGAQLRTAPLAQHLGPLATRRPAVGTAG
jgi:hypothetical protein